MKINYNFLKKLAFFVLSIYLLNINLVYSEIIKKIKVSGNDRLANETIILFSELNINDDINSEKLNTAFKKLYETDYFKNIEISFDNGLLSIQVKENPLIQSVIINGIKNKTILKELSKITKKIEKYPY